MNCDCIKRVNEKLAEQNLALNATFIPEPKKPYSTLSISTHFKDLAKKKRGQKPMSIIVTYCPFCGKKAKDAHEQQLDG